MSSIQNHIRVTGGQDRNDINKTLELIQDLFAAPSEDEAYHEKVALSTPKYRHTTSIEFGGPEWTISETPTYETFQFTKKIPQAVSSYPLIQTQVGAGALTFPRQNTKFGCRCDADGVNYITEDNHGRLNPTDELTISFWVYIPTGATSGNLVRKENQYVVNYTATDIEFSVYNAGWGTPISFTYTNDVWTHVTAKFDNANGITLFKDKVSSDSDGTQTTMATSSNKLGIFAKGDGVGISESGVRMALLSMVNKDVSQAWIDNHYIGYLDTSDGNNEILTIPFAGSESPMPDATSQSCRSSV